jgi:hypothetical protein
MQAVKSNQLEVGDIVVIDWPRTSWDHRRGRLHELRHETGEKGIGLVLLDGIAVGFPMESLYKTLPCRESGSKPKEMVPSVTRRHVD